MCKPQTSVWGLQVMCKGVAIACPALAGAQMRAGGRAKTRAPAGAKARPLAPPPRPLALGALTQNFPTFSPRHLPTPGIPSYQHPAKEETQ